MQELRLKGLWNSDSEYLLTHHQLAESSENQGENYLILTHNGAKALAKYRLKCGDPTISSKPNALAEYRLQSNDKPPTTDTNKLTSQLISTATGILGADVPTPTDATKQAIDILDYATATDVRTKYVPDGIVLDQKKLRRFLDLTPDIRTHRPRRNRLLVHLADWTRHREAFVEWYDSEPQLDESGAKERQAAIQKKPRRILRNREFNEK